MRCPSGACVLALAVPALVGACTGEPPVTETAAATSPLLEDDPPPRRSIALVGGALPDGATRRGDAAILARLDSQGIPAWRVDCTAPASETYGAWLVIISATCRSLDVGARYADDPRSVVVLEPSLFDDMRQAGPALGSDHDKLPRLAFQPDLEFPDSIAIGRPEHVVASGLAGEVVVYGQPHPLNWAVPSGDGVAIAHLVGQPERATVFVHDRGARMHGDVPAPARRVGLFPWHTDDYFPSHLDVGPELTDAGWTLFDAAIRWAVGDLAPLDGGGDLRVSRTARPWHPGTGATAWVLSPAWSRGVRSWWRRPDGTYAGLTADGIAIVETIAPVTPAASPEFRVVGGAPLPVADDVALADAFETDHALLSSWGRADYPAPPALPPPSL